MFAAYMTAGGPLMWPLLACSTALLAVLVERCWTLLLRRERGPDAGRVHRKVLPFFIEVPTSLGLLGTVLGLVQSFSLLGGGGDAVGQMGVRDIGSGLATACVTTIFGLTIALTATIAGFVLDWIVPPELEAA